MSADAVTRYDQMPIPPIPSQTEHFESGALRVGVQYRLLNDAIAAANDLVSADGDERGAVENVDDRGVALHVYLRTPEGWREHLRFDCFQEDPHYHYVCWSERFNHMLHLDATADGDPLLWALERLRTRLPQMLARAGAGAAADAVRPSDVDAVLPRVTEAAYRARFHHDTAAVLDAALDR